MTHSVGYLIGDAGSGRIMVAGVVAPGVARLSITPRHGAVFGVPLHRAPAVLHTRLEFFVTVVRGHARSLAPSPIRFFTTYAADDRPIERFTIPR